MVDTRCECVIEFKYHGTRKAYSDKEKFGELEKLVGIDGWMAEIDGRFRGFATKEELKILSNYRGTRIRRVYT